MKYDRIDKELFISNRKRFTQHMEGNALAAFTSNDVFPTRADSTLPFKQSGDIFHLSGVDQEDSILVIFPNAKTEKFKEVLFLTETNEHIAVWEGEKLTKEAALETSGIKTVFWRHEFETVFKQMMAEADTIYLNTNEHARAKTEVETHEKRFNKMVVNNFPAHQVRKSAPIMHKIRSVKHSIELDIMQNACNITKKGVHRVLKALKPGVMEYELEAEIMCEFLRNRSRGFAYTPIIASGKSACVLHYVENNKECKDGDLILMDFGAEYANYCSDLTRTFPVNGKFTDRQKDVYNAVLRVKKESEKLLVPGTMLGEYHKEVGNLMTSELIGLGLLDQTDVKNENPDWPAYKKYFMHGTSHFIGLDTHDLGLWSEPITENMVFTCEPGIYIPNENIGIRLEDDLVVREGKEPLNLMGDIPIEIEEIESIMND